MNIQALRIEGASAADMARLLSRLARKGAHLVRHRSEAGETYELSMPGQSRGRRDAPSDGVHARLVSYALTEGWLATEDDGRRLRLTESGALALRRGLAPEPVQVAAAKPETPLQASPKRTATVGAAGQASTTIDRLSRLKDAGGQALISDIGAEAGRRLGRDFLLGQMMPRVTANWDKAALGERPQGTAPGLGIDIRDSVSDAQVRVRRALDEAGPDLAGLLIDICCLDRGLDEVERERNWPPRSARIVLGIALRRLAAHYGMVANGPARGRGGPTHWGTPDYRPTLAAWTEPAATASAPDVPQDPG